MGLFKKKEYRQIIQTPVISEQPIQEVKEEPKLKIKQEIDYKEVLEKVSLGLKDVENYLSELAIYIDSRI